MKPHLLLPVQVNIMGISSDGRPSTVFRGPCISIRVHSGHKVDLGIRDKIIKWRHLCAVQQTGDSVIHAIVVNKVFCEGNKDLPPNELVAVHVAYVLHHRPQQWPSGSACRQAQANNWPALHQEFYNFLFTKIICGNTWTLLPRLYVETRSGAWFSKSVKN